jgi:hypothetical protein
MVFLQFFHSGVNLACSVMLLHTHVVRTHWHWVSLSVLVPTQIATVYINFSAFEPQHRSFPVWPRVASTLRT